MTRRDGRVFALRRLRTDLVCPAFLILNIFLHVLVRELDSRCPHGHVSSAGALWRGVGRLDKWPSVGRGETDRDTNNKKYPLPPPVGLPAPNHAPALRTGDLPPRVFVRFRHAADTSASALAAVHCRSTGAVTCRPVLGAGSWVGCALCADRCGLRSETGFNFSAL